MPFGAVTLVPGVNVERTATLLQAGYTSSSLVRFKDGLVQKIGGWINYFSLLVSGVPRELHVWQDLAGDDHLLIGSTQGLFVLTNGALANITPRQTVTDPPPNFSTTSGSPTVAVVDAAITNLSVTDAVFLNVPISVGGLVLFGMYQITQLTGPNSYNITASSNATSTQTNAGTVPVFQTVSGEFNVTVTIVNHGLVAGQGEEVVFQIPTTGNGVTIFKNYGIAEVIDNNNFTIVASNKANATGSFSMNGGNAELVYYLDIGPPTVGIGYGLGGYGLGPYGLGQGTASPVIPGTPITALDWTSANWGEIALACPFAGPIYQWSPSSGFTTASIVAGAPTFCGGIFVSTSLQILVAWGSSFAQAIGIQLDPLFVQWSAQGDYTDWAPTAENQAGGFRIPLGSKIMGGLSTPNQNLIWTDLDCWAMNYLGPPFVFGFNNIGSGAGLISSHAAIQLRGNVYWMSNNNFYMAGPQGVIKMQCPVWDAVFQNLNTAFASNVRAMPNTSFDEVGWLYPSTASVNGENDCYVKVNITEQGLPWDLGPSNALPRSAWTDQSVLGPPISTNYQGQIFQQETGFDAAGTAMPYSFTTGYFYIAEGEDFAFVDQIYPDFKYGFYGQGQNATIQIQINGINFQGDTPTVYGPFTINQATQFISCRIRNRQMQFVVSGNDLGSFMRLGKIRYRWSPAGRR